MSDMLDSPGVRVGNELNVFLPADTKLRCIGDRIIVEPLDWKPSSIIFVAGYTGRPLRGIVRAVGPGCYPLQYQHSETGEWSFSVPKGKRKAMRPSRAFRPCDVKVGDLVEFGGLEIGGFLHPTIMWGHKEVVLCREEDVCGIVEQEGCMSTTPQTLFHVELIVESKLLLRARQPEPPHPKVIEHWTDADFEKEVARCDQAEAAEQQLYCQSIHPALACILNCEKLNELLEQCGDNAIIRISLEKPVRETVTQKS